MEVKDNKNMSPDTHIFNPVDDIPKSGYLYKYVSVKRALEIIVQYIAGQVKIVAFC